MLIDANTSFGVCPRDTIDRSLATLLRLLERHSVTQALTYSRRGVEYDYVSGNEETRQACRQHPELLPVATIHPGRHVGWRDALLRMADQDFVALRFFPDLQGWPIVYQPFLDLCEFITDIGLPIILPAGPPGQQTLIGERLGPLGVPVLLVGAGYSVLGETVAVVQRWPHFYVETHLFNTPGTLEYLGQTIGFDRLIFGSNIPERSFEAAYHYAMAAALTPAQRADLLAGNVLRFLGRGGD